MDFDEKLRYNGDLPPNSIYDALLDLYIRFISIRLFE